MQLFDNNTDNNLAAASRILLGSVCIGLEFDICGCLFLPETRCIYDLLNQFVKRLLNTELRLCTALDKQCLQFSGQILSFLFADFSAGLLFD